MGGQTVIMSDVEVKQVSREDGGGIEITEAVAGIPPVYLAGAAYYLSPEDEAYGRAYDLLGAALREARLVALARWTWRGKTRVCAISPDEHGVLVLHTLHFAGALRDAALLAVERPAPGAAEVELAVKLLRTIQREGYDPAAYQDDAQVRLRRELERRANGGQGILAEVPASRPVLDRWKHSRQVWRPEGGVMCEQHAVKNCRILAAERMLASAKAEGNPTKQLRLVKQAQEYLDDLESKLNSIRALPAQNRL